MSTTGALRKNALQHTEELENAIQETESAYAAAPAPCTQDTWLHTHREYELQLLDFTKKTCSTLHKKCMSKVTKLGVYLARPDYTPSSIPRILTPLGRIADASQEIVEAFLSFYTDLYATKVQYSECQLNTYLTQVSLPSLSNRAREESPFPLKNLLCPSCNCS